MGGATIFSACGGGSDAQDQRTPTGNAGTPTPEATVVPTLPPTEAPTLVPTEAPKLYGPAPTIEGLEATLITAFAQNAPLELNRDVTVCLGQFSTARYEDAKTESNARLVLSKCQDLAQQLKNQVGDPAELEPALNGLRDAYFGGVEIFVGMGLLPSSELGQSRVESTIETYFSAK